jgi:SAM-dependent methyltransferase
MAGVYSLYHLLQPRFRQQRMRLFLELFRPSADTTILDIGGNVYDWINIPIQSRITILNIAPTDSSPEYPERFSYVAGDGRALPFPDARFDIVYSNSVIEHLRSSEDQQQFAKEVLRVGRGVFVQTPNRWFPVEPHFITPFVHFLPKSAQRRFLPRLSLRGMMRSGDNVALEDLFEELRLLSAGEMQEFFPGCQIRRERLLGLTKSLIAMRRGQASSEGGPAAI